MRVWHLFVQDHEIPALIDFFCYNVLISLEKGGECPIRRINEIALKGK